MNPILLFVWAALAACFAGLLIYRGQLTRNEDEQLFLNDGQQQNFKQQQTAIVRKVKMLQPIVRAIGGAACLVTACVVGLYVWEAWKTIN